MFLFFNQKYSIHTIFLQETDDKMEKHGEENFSF